MKDTLGAFVPGTDVRLKGADAGPLAGFTFAAKDIYDVEGEVTGCGNPDWARTHGPAAAAAPAVQALLNAGAELLGKTITDELAYSLNGQNFHYGTPTNVNAPGRIPGGSSSGSASAVAGGLVDLALGSDTGGSIRVPGSYCGLFGLRPTHGRIPLQGIMPLAPSFDTIGWFARDAALLRRAGEVLFGESAGDAPAPGPLLIAEDAFDLAEPAAEELLGPQIGRLVTRLGRVEPVTVGEPGGGLGAWMTRFRALQAREIWATHGAWIAETKPRFGPEIAERFAWVQTISDADAEAAKPEREAFAERLAALLVENALLCLPSAPGIAPRVDASAEALVDHRYRTLSLTCIAALARLPQITLPLAQLDGCPLGLSLIGPPGSDLTLLAFAEAFTREADTAPGF